jgi:hypothetical protein
MRISLTRAVAGIAIAATAATALVATAGAAGATTATKTSTTLSIVTAKSTITHGQWDAIGGTLKAGKTPEYKKIVELYRWDYSHKKWIPFKVNLTGKNGYANFAFRPAFTDSYELVYHGNSATLAGSHSGVVTIKVKPFVRTATTLSVAASPTSIAKGKSTKISGVLTAGTKAKPLSEAVIRLYKWLPATKKWDLIAVNLTGSKGGVSFVRKPDATASYELVYNGGGKIAGSHSGVVTITVTQ